MAELSLNTQLFIVPPKSDRYAPPYISPLPLTNIISFITTFDGEVTKNILDFAVH